MKDSNVHARNDNHLHRRDIGSGVSVAPVNDAGAARCALVRAEVAYLAALRIEQQALVELGKALEAVTDDQVDNRRGYVMILFRLKINNSESLGIMEARVKL